MKKILILAFLISLFIFGEIQAFPVLDSVYDNIKDQALASLKGTFNRPIKIERASGKIIGEIVLNNVSVGDELFFDKFIINFNPIKYASKNFDIMPAITSIKLVGGRVKVLRDKKGNILISDILKTGEGGGPPFKALIYYENLDVYYEDIQGLPYKGKGVKEKFEDVFGKVDMRKTPKINFSLQGKGSSSSKIKASGNLNMEKGEYDLKVSGENIQAKSFGNYFSPFFDFKKGEVDVSAQIGNKGIKIYAKGNIDNIPLKVEGKVFGGLDLKIWFENANVLMANEIFPEFKNIDFSGNASGSLILKGPYDKIYLSSDLKFRDSSIYGIKFAGKTTLEYANSILKVKDSEFDVFDGKIYFPGEMDFSKKNQDFFANGKFSNINFKKLSSNSPGVEGFGSGLFLLKGDTKRFSADLKGTLSSSYLFGQRVKSFEGNMFFNDGALAFNNIRIASDNSEFIGQGEMSKDGKVSISANARGIRVSGNGIFGKMQAMLERFSGKISFIANNDFFKYPMRNLSASGKVKIRDAVIGEQLIEAASGEVVFGNGEIKIKEMYAKQGNSVVFAEGETGLGVSTKLNVVSEKSSLEDLKILNYFLPERAKNPKGTLVFSAEVSGFLKEMNTPEDFLNLNLSINAGFLDCKLGDSAIKAARIKGDFAKDSFSLKDIYVKTHNTDISGYLGKSSDEVVKGRMQGVLDLKEASLFFPNYVDLSGTGKFDFWVSGDVSAPVYGFFGDFKKIHFNDIAIDSIKGNIYFNKNILSTKNLSLSSGTSKLEVFGGITLNKDLPLSVVNVNASLFDPDAGHFSILAFNIYEEINRQLKPVIETDIRIKKGEVSQNIGDHSKDISKILKYFGKMENDVEKYKNKQPAEKIETIKGAINVRASVYNTLGSLYASIKGDLKNGSYGRYSFDRLDLSGIVSSEGVDIKRLEIKKSDGKGYLYGSWPFLGGNGKISFGFQDMPMDIFTVFLDKNFSGRFSSRGTIEGSIENPAISLWLKTGKIMLGPLEFENSSLSLSMLSGEAYFKTNLTSNGKKSDISGSYNLKNGDCDILSSVEGNVLGLAELFSNDIKWYYGDSSGKIRVVSRKGKHKVYGNLSLSNLSLRINPLNSDLAYGEVSLEADGEKISLNKATGYLYDKRGNPSAISISGYFLSDSEEFSLKFADSNMHFDISNLYVGDVYFKDFAVYGKPSLFFVSGEISAKDGLFYLPNMSNALARAKSPANLLLKLNIGKNVYLTAGNIDTVNLSNVLLNLEMQGNNLSLLGDPFSPKIKGRINFKRGTINIFNREFSLLTQTKKQEFYPYEVEDLSLNYAEFNEETLPYLNLYALAKVDSYEEEVKTTETTQPKRKEIFIISHLTGIPGSMEKERAIKITFDSFYQDKNVTPYAYRQTGYFEDKIKVLLLPDFIKSAAGIDKKTNVEANAVVADYLNSRFQTFVFRGIERQIEKALGLESLTLEYNFGKDLRKAFGSKDPYYGQTQTFGVGFVKGFFDRLYIDVRYAQTADDINPQEGTSYINYQLTYKLTPALSIAYYREPISVYQLESGYYKITLRTGFSF